MSIRGGRWSKRAALVGFLSLLLGVAGPVEAARASGPTATVTVNGWSANLSTGAIDYNVGIFGGGCSGESCQLELWGWYVNSTTQEQQQQYRFGSWSLASGTNYSNTLSATGAVLPEITDLRLVLTGAGGALRADSGFIHVHDRYQGNPSLSLDVGTWSQSRATGQTLYDLTLRWSGMAGYGGPCAQGRLTSSPPGTVACLSAQLEGTALRGVAAGCVTTMVLIGGICGIDPGSGASDSSTKNRTGPKPSPRPTLPVPPPGKDGNPSDCPRPPGSLGTYGELTNVNKGFPQCEAHHIIQHAAVRDVPGYSYSGSPAVVLSWAQHQLATAAQNTATVGGTYGAEVTVADRALVAAGQLDYVISAALNRADIYFQGQLGLTYNSGRESGVRIPCSRYPLRAVCG